MIGTADATFPTNQRTKRDPVNSAVKDYLRLFNRVVFQSIYHCNANIPLKKHFEMQTAV